MSKSGLMSMLSPGLGALGGQGPLPYLSPAVSMATGKGLIPGIGKLMGGQNAGAFAAISPLLSALLGGGGGEEDVSQPQPMSQGVMGFPSVPMGRGGIPGAISEAGAMPSYGEGQDVEVVGDGWKPRKPTILGALADAYLTYSGKPPAFSINRNARSMREAMEGFTDDPTRAINRLSKIPGMQDEAWKLLNQYQDNARADGTLERQNRQLDDRNEREMHSYAAAMMGSPAVNEQTWPKFREMAIQRAKSRGVDMEHLIPEQYDPESVDFFRWGEVKPKDQMKMADDRSYRGQRLNQIDRGLDIRQEGVDNTERYREERLEDFDNAEAGKNSRSAGRGSRKGGGGVNPKNYANRAYKDSNGSLVEFDKTGTKIKVTHKSGKVLYFKLGVDGKPVPVGAK